MPDITITVPTTAVSEVSAAYDNQTGAALIAAVKADLAAYLKEKVRGYHDRAAREAAAAAVVAPDIT